MVVGDKAYFLGLYNLLPEFKKKQGMHFNTFKGILLPYFMGVAQKEFITTMPIFWKLSMAGKADIASSKPMVFPTSF